MEKIKNFFANQVGPKLIAIKNKFGNGISELKLMVQSQTKSCSEFIHRNRGVIMLAINIITVIGVVVLSIVFWVEALNTWCPNWLNTIASLFPAMHDRY